MIRRQATIGAIHNALCRLCVGTVGASILIGLALLAFAGRAWSRPYQAGGLQNPGFEAGPTAGWEVTTYGAKPRLERDTAIVREGRSALRVTADALSDTALGQEVRLKPGGWYRLTGWVRTRGLDPHGAPVYGTFQIQQSGGRGIIATGRNHSGDTAWTEEKIVFTAPRGGLTRICVFFVGFGKGTGTAWFDGLRLEEVDMSHSTVRITHEPLCPGTISPLQYGQFVEYLCDVVPSMWAEKLYDGSFEGLSPYKVVFLKETDFKEKPWVPSGQMNRAVYSLDPETKISGEVSQKIAVEGDPPCTVGIEQSGIAVERGAACRFSCWLRQSGDPGPVQVTLHREGRVYAASSFTPTDEWRKYQARLVPAETDAGATLSITFRGPATLWLDNASLMPEDTVGGWRRDVVEAVRALKPGIIRFGGSTLDDKNLGDFEWKDTIGDPDRRRPFRAWGGLQPTGPGLEEFVQFCRYVAAEPLICVRFNGREPRDAFEEVQYFNGAADTPMGALRAKNGHPEPYHIRYWQVGNEITNPEYADRLAAFCQAMKEADPPIKLLSSYPSPERIRKAGRWLDYACPHHYGCNDLAGKANDLEAIRRMIQENAPGRPMRVAVTEWNTTGGDWGPPRAMLWTLANALACSRYQNLLHRYCDLVEIANRSNLINSFCSGIVQVDNHRLFKTPTYYAQQLYATLAGTRPLKLDSDVPANVGLDLSATLSADGSTVTLFAVNDTPEPIARPLDLSAFGAAGQEVAVRTLADREKAGEPDATNSFADPERIATVVSSFHAPDARFEYRFPPYSLTVLTWKVETHQP